MRAALVTLFSLPAVALATAQFDSTLNLECEGADGPLIAPRLQFESEVVFSADTAEVTMKPILKGIPTAALLLSDQETTFLNGQLDLDLLPLTLGQTPAEFHRTEIATTHTLSRSTLSQLVQPSVETMAPAELTVALDSPIDAFKINQVSLELLPLDSEHAATVLSCAMVGTRNPLVVSIGLYNFDSTLPTGLTLQCQHESSPLLISSDLTLINAELDGGGQGVRSSWRLHDPARALSQLKDAGFSLGNLVLDVDAHYEDPYFLRKTQLVLPYANLTPVLESRAHIEVVLNPVTFTLPIQPFERFMITTTGITLSAQREGATAATAWQWAQRCTPTPRPSQAILRQEPSWSYPYHFTTDINAQPSALHTAALGGLATLEIYPEPKDDVELRLNPAAFSLKLGTIARWLSVYGSAELVNQTIENGHFDTTVGLEASTTMSLRLSEFYVELFGLHIPIYRGMTECTLPLQFRVTAAISEFMPEDGGSGVMTSRWGNSQQCGGLTDLIEEQLVGENLPATIDFEPW